MKNLSSIAILLLMSYAASAQLNVGSTAQPDASAILQLSSSDKGLRLPNVSLASTVTFGLTAPTSAAEAIGMIVYNTNTDITGTADYPANGAGVYSWDGSGWKISTPNTSTVYSAVGTTSLTIAAGSTADLPGASVTFSLAKATNVLVSYSALGLPNATNAPVQGTVDLMVDGSKVNSTYYAGWDAPSSLVRLGNYCTGQYVLSGLEAGSHTIKLRAKSWYNTSLFNRDPTASPAYGGAVASDAGSMKARICILILPN